MSVLIIDLKMPKNCVECPLQHCFYLPHNYLNAKLYETPALVCAAVGAKIENGTKREDYCPLIEVPPHGRLIDADALDKHIYNDVPLKVFGNIARMADMRTLIDDAPTIIEAEEPLWKRMVEAAEEYGKHIPEEVMRKVEKVICETVCIDKEDKDG